MSNTEIPFIINIIILKLNLKCCFSLISNFFNLFPYSTDEQFAVVYRYWVIQQSWFGRVNVLCNLSCKKSQEVAVHFQVDF